jgi:hypothetical protein
MTILMVFYKKNFNPDTFKVIVHISGIIILIGVISTLLEKRAIRKYKNKHQ